MTKSTFPLLVSLLLHGALLALPAVLLSSPGSLRPMPPLQVALLAAQPTMASDPPRSSRQPTPLSQPVVRSQSLSKTMYSPVSLPDSGTVTVATQSNAVPTTPYISPAAAMPTAMTTSPSTPPAHQAEDDNSLARYGQRLSEWLAKQQHYPRLAEIRGWEGEVRLQLRIARKGALLDVQVSRSSGHEILDRNAMQLVQENPLPPLPTGLSQSSDEEIRITVPIQYRLGKRTS